MSAPQRKKIPLSCLTCKRKKVRCDRAQPTCGACEKSGLGSSCKYQSGVSRAKEATNVRSGLNERRAIVPADAPPVTSQTPLSILSGPRTPAVTAITPNGGSAVDDSAEKVRQLEEKMIILENILKRPRDSIGDAETGDIDSIFADKSHASIGEMPSTKRQAKVESRVKGLLAGKDFKTKYYGASHAGSLLAEFPELSKYWTDVDRKFPSLSRLRGPLKAAKLSNPRKLPKANIDAQALLSLLPDRSVTDKLVKCYLEGLDTIYHVLHVPSFFMDYDRFWNAPSDQPDIDFAVLLFLVIAAVCSVPELERMTYVGQSSASRESAIEWIEVGEIWINSHSQKHISLRYFQIRCLLIIAQRMNDYKPKRAWVASGNLLRFAIAAGYHREPTLLKKKTSVFDQEMRRRLWATIVELDLQACLERGMLPSIKLGEWDCNPPSNILDSELESCRASDSLPKCGPASSFTPSSFLRASQESLALRLELISLINQLNGNMTHPQVIAYDDKIVQTLDELPVWADADPETDESLPSPTLAQTLLRTQLLAFRVLIHRQSTLSHTPHNRSHYSRTICLDCASQILSQYESLQDGAYYSLLLYTDDVFRAAFNICFDLVQTQGGLRASQDGGVFIRRAEVSLAMLEEKALRLGRGVPEFGTVSVAYCLAQSQLSRDSAVPPKEDAANRITALYQKLMSSQERPLLPYDAPNGNKDADLMDYSKQPGLGESSDQLLSADQAPFNSLSMDIDYDFWDPFGWSHTELC